MTPCRRDESRDDENLNREASADRNRRILLGAAGGFALATSGLLLPAWLIEDTAAAEQPVRRVQHRAAKRRQRRHHRLRQKRRLQRRRQRRNPGLISHLTDLLYLELPNNTGMPVLPWHGDSYLMEWHTGGGDTVGLSTEFELSRLGADAAGLEFLGFPERRPFVSVDSSGGASNVNLYYGGAMSAAGYVGGSKEIDNSQVRLGEEAIGFIETGPGQRHIVTITCGSDERSEHQRTRGFLIRFTSI
jgi:hypothetical protein